MNNIGYEFLPSEISTFRQKILAAKHVGILPHTRADGDALGSAEGLRLALQKLGVSSVIICPDVPKVTLACPFEIAKYSVLPDLLISVDCASLERCFYPEEFKSIFFINIDHHQSNTNFASLNIVRVVSSACEVLVALLYETFGEEVFDEEVAEAFLFGILCDTLTFSTSEVSQHTFAITEFLIKKGANYQNVKSNLRHYISVENFYNWSKVILLSQIKLDGKVLLLKVDKALILEKHFQSSMFVGFINRVAGTVETDVVIFMSEFEENSVDVSMRSKVTDVAVVAQDFSGGGHVHAAGFKVKGLDIVELERRLLARMGI